MFKIFFNMMIGLLATLVQIIVLPLNVVISSALPDLSQKITEVGNTFSNLFNNMSWALGIIPNNLTGTLIFIVTCEIARHFIYISTHALIKVWNVIQKVKFW